MRRRADLLGSFTAALLLGLALWPTTVGAERAVALRDAKVTDEGRTVATVLKGTEVEIVGTGRDGYRIRYLSGEQAVSGWVDRDALVPIREPAASSQPPEAKPSRFTQTKHSPTEQDARSRAKWEELRVGRFLLLYEGKRFQSGVDFERLEPIVQTIVACLYDPRTKRRFAYTNEVRIYLCRGSFADLARKLKLNENEPAFAEAAPAFFFNCDAGPVSMNTVVYFLTDAVFGQYMNVEQYPAWLRDGLSVHVEALMGLGVKYLDSLPDLPDIDILLDPVKSGRNLSDSVYSASCGALIGFLVDTQGPRTFAALCDSLRRSRESKAALFQTCRFGSRREFDVRVADYVKEWRAEAIEAELALSGEMDQ